ncbi:hypothetical protein CONPUDRAFT_168544 [Coniophora puteana RWD-64-598 SS2]|uniref:Uncharacterized protein n=1 Tax=Coniophora puteana (strain RWD-64-598) TaxID=741705 RepID=A0A5M3MC49_CONPW|nr:uncharacterized protein CONPUDRAFT_168544 [Coniophora puteana RWD-64-598 SS2]EIW76778.1 hypothetical protein CONPUDRAFT_168544 [Coniophora puteana RWD-64-598 SS2]
MSLQPYNQTVTTPLPTWLDIPDWTTINSLIPDEGLLKAFTTLRPGINGSTLYDTLQPTSTVGTARVNATTLGYVCRLVPGIKQTPPDPITAALEPSITEDLEWNGLMFPVSDVPWTDQVLFNVIFGDMLRESKVNSPNSSFGVPMTYHYVDPLPVPLVNDTTDSKTVQAFFAGSAHHPSLGTAHREWEGLPTIDGHLGNSVGNASDDTYFNWLTIAMGSSLIADITDITCSQNNSGTPPLPASVLDAHIMQLLGFNAAIIRGNPGGIFWPPGDPTQSIALADFENALAVTTAELLWTAGQLTQNGYSPDVVTAEAMHFELTWRVNINLTPLLFAFCASVITLVLEMILVGWQVHDNPAVSNVGILEMMWLIDHEPALRSKFSEVGRPTNDNLREAGMFDVHLTEEMVG